MPARGREVNAAFAKKQRREREVSSLIRSAPTSCRGPSESRRELRQDGAGVLSWARDSARELRSSRLVPVVQLAAVNSVLRYAFCCCFNRGRDPTDASAASFQW
jgi:hypothetical protein